MNIFRVFSLITLILAFISAMPTQIRTENIGLSLVHNREKRGPTDLAELESFIVDFMAKQMQPNQVAGASISVVKDGQLFCQRLRLR